MCGITARVGTATSLDELLTSLENLEYRGYDSTGVAFRAGEDVTVYKRKGEVDGLREEMHAESLRTVAGIGHTRWSTHGPPTDENAHPHVDCTGRIAVVHNGIIENYAELRAELQDRGHEFTSDTDTEVVPHLVEEALEDGCPPEEAFRHALSRIEGAYAAAMLVAGTDVVYGARDGSPLVLGLGDGANYLASDVPAFLEFTDRVVFLEDGDAVAVGPDSYRMFDHEGRPVERETETVDWQPQDAEKGRFDHYMLKEIHEQPESLRQAVRGRITDDHAVDLEGFPPGAFADVDEVHLVGCGTSFRAGMYGAHLLRGHGVPAQVRLANEYATTPTAVGESTLVIAVTQSGETADTLGAVRRAARAGARTLALTNVIGSTAARECDDAMFIRAGPEIGVAATKTFSSQVVALTLLAEQLGRDLTGEVSPESRDVLRELSRLPESVRQVLERSTAGSVARQYAGSDAYFFIGRGSGYAVALEGALKFKEITYEHAEGFAAGELKHGPLALVTPSTPVFAVFTGEHENRLLGNVEEVQARGAPVIAVAPERLKSAHERADASLPVPNTHPSLASVLANVQLQLLSYHAADRLGRPIDKPRNLAKSVTVE